MGRLEFIPHQCEKSLVIHHKNDGENEDDEARECISYKIPKNEKTNFEIKFVAKNGLEESYLLLKKDINVITHHHIQRLMIYKSSLKQENAAGTSSSPVHHDPDTHIDESVPHVPYSDSPDLVGDLFMDAEYHKYFDRLANQYLGGMKKLHTKKSPTDDIDFDCPSFELLPQDDAANNEDKQSAPLNEDLEAEFNLIVANVDRRKQAKKSARRERRQKAQKIAKQVPKDDVNVVQQNIVNPLQANNCEWIVDDEAKYKSSFIKKYMISETGVSRKENDIADFCFYHHPLERVTNVFEHHLSKSFVSLEGEPCMVLHLCL